MKKHILLLLAVASMASTAWGQVVIYGDSNYMFHHLDTNPPLLLYNSTFCNKVYDVLSFPPVGEAGWPYGQEGSIFPTDTTETIYGIAFTADTVTLSMYAPARRDKAVCQMLYLYVVPAGSSDYTLLDSVVFDCTMPYHRKFVYRGVDPACATPLMIDTVTVYELLFSHGHTITAGDSVLVTRMPLTPPKDHPHLRAENGYCFAEGSIQNFPHDAYYRIIRNGELTCYGGGYLGPLYPIRHRACPKLSEVRVDTVDGTTVCLSWHLEGNAQHYRVEYGPEGFQYGGGAYSEGIILDSIGDTTICLSGLSDETVYTFFVSTYCDKVLQYSMPDSVRALTGHNPECAQPGRFRMVGRTTNSMIFQWDTVVEQQEFEMLVKRSDNNSEQRIRPDSNPYKLTDLAAGVVYSVWLRARCHHECVVHDTVLWGPWSGPLQFRFTPQGVEEVGGGLKATLVPNPARGIFTVELAEEAGTPGIGSTVTVTDMAGRVLLTAPLLSARQLVDASALPAGTYFVTLATPQGSSTQKLILE